MLIKRKLQIAENKSIEIVEKKYQIALKPYFRDLRYRDALLLIIIIIIISSSTYYYYYFYFYYYYYYYYFI